MTLGNVQEVLPKRLHNEAALVKEVTQHLTIIKKETGSFLSKDDALKFSDACEPTTSKRPKPLPASASAPVLSTSTPGAHIQFSPLLSVLRLALNQRSEDLSFMITNGEALERVLPGIAASALPSADKPAERHIYLQMMAGRLAGLVSASRAENSEDPTAIDISKDIFEAGEDNGNLNPNLATP